MLAVAPVSPYLHVLEGRLRIKIPELKGTHRQARALEQHLLTLAGIHDASANPTTGNVLILFDSSQLDHGTLITAIQQCGYLASTASASPVERKNLSHVVFQSAVELAIERLVLALI